MELAAHKYNRSNKLQIRDGKELIEIIKKENPNKKYDVILDIGCGSGNVTLLLSQELDADRVYGVDIDDQMIAFAKENHSNDKITYLAQDFGQDWEQLSPELKSLEGRVSLIFTNHCLHWIANKENVVMNLKRLLSSDGLIYANIYWISDLYLDLSPEEKAIHEKEFMKVPTKEEQRNVWIGLFDKYGLEIHTDKFITKDIVFDQDVFHEHILPLGITIRRVYFSKKSLDDYDNKVKDLNKRALNRCQKLKDEKTGNELIEFKYAFFQFVISK